MPLTNSPLLDRAAVPNLPQGAQLPRISVWPDGGISSAADEAIELARLAGLELDPWEAWVLAQALAERADGRWAAFEVGTVVPRQNGKDVILEARELAGLFLFGEQLLIHSAHEQATATEHFRRLLGLIESVPELDRRVMRAPKGKGAEAIELRDGTRILFKTRTGGGGRGFTGDFVALNEAMILPAAFTGALVPTMAARSMLGNPQLWYAGSAPDQQANEHGVVLSRLRARALAGAPRVGYAEWSIEGDDPDLVSAAVRHDPMAWAQSNPGLGIRISHEHVANEAAGALGPREFAVERLGVGDWPNPEPDEDDEAIIRQDAWAGLTDERSSAEDPVCLAIDVRPDFRTAAIGAAGRRRDSLHHVEVVEHQVGTAWVVPWLVDRFVTNPRPEYKGVAVVYDEKSPAAAIVKDAIDQGVPMQPVNGRQYADACGRLLVEVEQRTVRHLGTEELANAIRIAGTRPLGDSWAWSRRSSKGDISPLVAVTLALWGLDGQDELPPPIDPAAFRITRL